MSFDVPGFALWTPVGLKWTNRDHWVITCQHGELKPEVTLRTLKPYSD